MEKSGIWINGSGIQEWSKRGYLLWYISGDLKARSRKYFKNYLFQSPRNSGKMQTELTTKFGKMQKSLVILERAV